MVKEILGSGYRKGEKAPITIIEEMLMHIPKGYLIDELIRRGGMEVMDIESEQESVEILKRTEKTGPSLVREHQGPCTVLIVWGQ
jgi:hypothetical protein